MESVLHRMKKGCILALTDEHVQHGLPCDDMKAKPLRDLDCLKCRNDLRYETVLYRMGRTHLTNRRTLALYGVTRIYNHALPFCNRCGTAHNRRTLSGDTDAYCQRCDDELAVEAFVQHRGIFGADDDEAILDRIQRSHPALFERGVLPDYWFSQTLAHVTKSPE
jgi:hypothetical protein